MDEEIWKDIPGYEGLYQASNLGRVRGRRKNACKVLSPSTYNGYYRVNLSRDGKYTTFHVHHLVAFAFLPNPNNYPQVNHLDGNRKNNILSNLEWCSRSQNQIHAFRVLGRVKTRCKTVIQMDDEGNIINKYESISEANRRMGVSTTSIRQAMHGKTKHSAGYKWIEQ